MQDQVSNELIVAMERAGRCCGTDASLAVSPPKRSSRRRRLWELEAHAHCPVIGVCLSIEALRRIYIKVKENAPVVDYELHCNAMADCKQRTALADALQKEFDRRYAVALRQSDQAKTTDALATWWREHRDGGDLPGAVWGTLTHSRCTYALEHQVLGEVHMLQHQIGAAQRVNRERHAAVLDEVSIVRHELIALQLRHRQQADKHSHCVEEFESALIQARAEIVRRGIENVALTHELNRVQEKLSGLGDQATLSRENARYRLRMQEMELALAQSSQDANRQRACADRWMQPRPDEQAFGVGDTATVPSANGPGARLDNRAVLCVGGRTASVPLYRHIVERIGGQFLHHDGGDEQSVARLDVTLARADLVICQTGCISHDAYWRVKDHCKRTGKPCVFVDNPGTASLKRALAEFAPTHHA